MPRIELPAVTSVRGKYVAGALTVLLSALLYIVPNRWQAVPPEYLTLSSIDNAVPFWPASGLVYISIYFFLTATFVALRDFAVVSRFVYACLFAQVIAAVCFVVWPIVYPRELYLAPTASRLDAEILELVRSMDTPANCLPSLHVSTAVLCAVALRADRDTRLGALIALPLALSTLTFKQHYFVDVLAGLALGLLAGLVFFRWRLVELRAPHA